MCNLRTLTLAILLLNSQSATMAQKKNNYLSLESGWFYSNTNADIARAMINSGLAYNSNNSPYGIDFTSRFPKKTTEGFKFRIRYGRNIGAKTVIEAGFGLSYNGTVLGGNSDSVNYLAHNSNSVSIDSRIYTFHVLFLKTNRMHSAGLGIGPVIALNQITQSGSTAYFPSDAVTRQSTRFQPGVTGTAFWNFVNRPAWFMTIRTEASLLIPRKVESFSFTNHFDGQLKSNFKETRAGSLMAAFTLGFGFRFQ